MLARHEAVERAIRHEVRYSLSMIHRQEIDEKAAEFDITPTNVERDYVFGWLLFAIYNNAYLSDLLILKGGNCFRKGYFPNTRFSSDLDFSTEQAVDLERLVDEIEKCCKHAQGISGIQFVTERNSFKEEARANLGKNNDRRILKGKVFFRDFYGARSTLEISVRMDVTEFDWLHMPVSTVPVIHPYSDADKCQVELRCVALEEAIASKLKCLLQRRHSHDLYDLVYAAFFDDEIELDRSEVARVFLRKTIFGSSPGSARQILLGLPMPFFRAAWERYIVCPIESRITFDEVEGLYARFIESIFETTAFGSRLSEAFFPAELRNAFLQAGSERKLLRLSYDGYERVVEPYALSYKRPANGAPREYFYVWDRVGGSSGPGIKALVNPKVERPIILDETFEPRYEIELSKAGEESSRSYFGGTHRRRSVSRRSVYAGGPVRLLQCMYCERTFKRKTASARLKPHKDRNGYDCYGRQGVFVGWE